MPKFGRTPLHVALRAGPVSASALDALAADLNTRDAHGFTPLYTAAMFNRVDEIVHLVSLGADATLADLGGLTPLHIACEKGRAEAALCLLRRGGADRGARDSIGRTPRDWAVAKGHADVVSALDAHAAGNRPPPLGEA